MPILSAFVTCSVPRSILVSPTVKVRVGSSQTDFRARFRNSLKRQVRPSYRCRRHFPIACEASRNPPSSETAFPTSQKPLLSALRLGSVCRWLTNLFPLWLCIGAITAFFKPAAFLWFRSSYIVPTLSIIMLGMGLTIDPDSFSAVLKVPHHILLGACAQYTLMPLLACAVSYLLRLPPALAAGVILVGVCPGGAASNVICLLARANVAFSVVLTLTSTILSVVLIPSLMQVLAGTLVPVAPLALLKSTAQVVLLPLLLGCVLQRLFPRLVAATSNLLPLVSALGVTAICSAVIAANATALYSIGFKLVLAITIMHLLGGVAGYIIGAVFGLDVSSTRTLSIEVMMQNSSLAVSLANVHFANPATAVPGAVSATMHSVLGSILAAIWRFSSSKQPPSMVQEAPITVESLYRELDEEE